MPRLTDFEKFEKERDKEHGAYTFHVSREKKLWVYVPVSYTHLTLPTKRIV